MADPTRDERLSTAFGFARWRCRHCGVTEVYPISDTGGYGECPRRCPGWFTVIDRQGGATPTEHTKKLVQTLLRAKTDHPEMHPEWGLEVVAAMARAVGIDPATVHPRI